MKLSRHVVIRDLISQREIGSQDELRRALFHRGHRVTQATLSRDIHELGLVKTAEGYKLSQGEERTKKIKAWNSLFRRTNRQS